MNKFKTLIIYHYFEKNLTYRKNFAHFLRFGISKENFYVILCSSNTLGEIPTLNNVLAIEAPNSNLDFGAYCFFLQKKQARELISLYDFVGFINSTVRGPYTSNILVDDWTTCFTRVLSDEIRMSGTTINYLPISSPKGMAFRRTLSEQVSGSSTLAHLQTMVFFMKSSDVNALLEDGFFTLEPPIPRDELIIRFEIGLSQRFLNNGNAIFSLAEGSYSRSTDQAVLPPCSKRSFHEGDPCFPYSFYGRTIHPYEVIFPKANRGLYTESFLDNLSFIQARRLSSVKGLPHLCSSPCGKKILDFDFDKSPEDRITLFDRPSLTEKEFFQLIRSHAKTSSSFRSSLNDLIKSLSV